MGGPAGPLIEMAEDGELLSEDIHFAIHAIYLPGELRATESLPVVLETFSQGEEFIEIWFGDFITGSLWEPLYFMGNNQLDHHQPHRKEEVTAWFNDLLAAMAWTGAKEDVMWMSSSTDPSTRSQRMWPLLPRPDVRWQ